MVISCVAYGCTNRQTNARERTFHRFPLSRPELLKKWVLATRRKAWFPTKYSFICGDHFTEDDYRPSGYKRKCLKDDAIPSVFIFSPKKKTKQIIKKPSNVQENGKPLVVYVKMEIKQETDSTDLPNNEGAEL